MLAPSLAAAAAKEAPRYVIADLELVHVRINKRGNWIIPRLKTSNGLSGLGDASQSTDDAQCIGFLKQDAQLIQRQVEWYSGRPDEYQIHELHQ